MIESSHTHTNLCIFHKENFPKAEPAALESNCPSCDVSALPALPSCILVWTPSISLREGTFLLSRLTVFLQRMPSTIKSAKIPQIFPLNYREATVIEGEHTVIEGEAKMVSPLYQVCCIWGKRSKNPSKDADKVGNVDKPCNDFSLGVLHNVGSPFQKL